MREAPAFILIYHAFFKVCLIWFDLILLKNGYIQAEDNKVTP